MQLSSLCFRLKFIFVIAGMLSACGQPGALYLPGTIPPFYVPPDAYKDDDKPEPEEQQPKTKTEPVTGQQKPVPDTETEPESTQQPQKQLDQPPSQQ